MVEGWSRHALKFSDYYSSLNHHKLWTPPRLKSREWMFIPWGSRPPERHRGFLDKPELLKYLQSRAPHSCFHSTAYYKYPSERKMIDKEWLGADLIFDLDGDHLPGVSDRDFPTMINLIQEQAWSLWDDFLKPEFGFKEEYIQTSFSGHRGFHIHVRDPKLFHLDSNARRELVNHIRGEGIDVRTTLAGVDSRWKNRVQKGIQTVVEKLKNISNEKSKNKDLIDNFNDILVSRNSFSDNKFKSLKSKTITKKILQLADLSIDENRIKRLNNDSSLLVFGEALTPLFWELVKGDSSVILGNAGETDEAVTVDVKRVIRHVGSLHGKCGLRVTDFPLKRLNPYTSEKFDPLSETIVFKGEKMTKLKFIVDDAIASLNDIEVSGSKGDIVKANESLSTFLTLKGWAEVVH
jgi:DNA primase small subunit